MPKSLDPAAWIDRAAHLHPQDAFLKTPQGRVLSYADLRHASGRMAATLAALGVQPGERVAVQAEKSVDALLLYVACLRMGAVFVPISTANTVNEVEHFLKDSQPRVAVVRPQDHARIAPVAAAAGVAHLETLGEAGEGTLPQRTLEISAGAEYPSVATGHSLAAIVYTSGTTGRSKGAMLTRANLASNAAGLAEAWRFTRADCVLHVLPLFHIHGLFVAVNTVLYAGASLCFMPKFEPGEAIAQMRNATVFMGVPTHYTRLLQQADLDTASTRHMRLFVSGSAPLLVETHREFERRTHQVILERYGMTETLINSSNPYEGERLAGSVGPPLPGVDIRIAHPDTGSVESAADSIGVLQIKGPNVFAGYWRDEAKTRAEFTADGWFKSGDLGRIDARGYVHIVGRAKDLVISGGYNVYPKEVESELDGLEGVLESAVFGVPHPDFGEGVTAAVVAKPGAQLTERALIEFIQSRVARYKVPKRIVLVAELPRNAMGKVQKNALRKLYETLYRA
jgi:malonyl-CoA/methylmalonyl-CoA synthetase